MVSGTYGLVLYRAVKGSWTARPYHSSIGKLPDYRRMHFGCVLRGKVVRCMQNGRVLAVENSGRRPQKFFSPKNQDGCPKHELSSIFFGGRGIGVCILGSFLGENRAPQGEFFHELHTPIVSHFK